MVASQEPSEPNQESNAFSGASPNFQAQAEEAETSLVREFIDFLQHNKKWWLTPILVAVLLLMFLVVLSLSPVAPFIYTLF